MSMPGMKDETGEVGGTAKMGMPGMGMPELGMPGMGMSIPGQGMDMPMPAMIGMPMSSVQGGWMGGMGAAKMPGMTRIQDMRTTADKMGLPHMMTDTADKRDVCQCCKLSKKSSLVLPWDCTFADLRAAYGCSKCKFALACVNWAVPKLFRHQDIDKIRVHQDEPLEVHLRESYRIIRLEFFTLSGKSKKLPVR